jgi:hypothetical protein
MKGYIIKLRTLLLLLLLASNRGQAQESIESMKQVIDITADDLGNASLDVSMKLNAQQWDMLKKSMGNNTSIFKREMEKALPKYFLSDFNYSEDQMERTYKLKFKVLGLLSINKDGIWEAKLDTKKPDITKLSDREYVITENLNVNGSLVQQTQKLHLPEGAENVKLEKDSFGKAVLRYSLGGSSSSLIFMILGGVLIAAGGFLFFRSSRKPA